MKLANWKVVAPTITLGLVTSLMLTGCGASDETPEPTATASVSPSATPDSGASGELEEDEVQFETEPSLTPPAGTEHIYSDLPAGEWSFVEADNATVGVTNSYDPQALQHYADRMLAEGWLYSVEPELVDDSYVAVLTNSDLSETITLVGAATGAPDANGELNAPVSSIVYAR